MVREYGSRERASSMPSSRASAPVGPPRRNESDGSTASGAQPPYPYYSYGNGQPPPPRPYDGPSYPPPPPPEGPPGPGLVRSGSATTAGPYTTAQYDAPPHKPYGVRSSPPPHPNARPYPGREPPTGGPPPHYPHRHGGETGSYPPHPPHAAPPPRALYSAPPYDSDHWRHHEGGPPPPHNPPPHYAPPPYEPSQPPPPPRGGGPHYSSSYKGYPPPPPPSVDPHYHYNNDPRPRPPPQQPERFPHSNNNEVDGREGATSPTQIENCHRTEVTNMGCTCKKTKCLKLYCQCFAVKIYCGPNCRCMVCCNNAQNEKVRKDAIRSILNRNPGAFDTKFRKTLHGARNIASMTSNKPERLLAHKLGCKCRRSACMKKYCECYAGNVKCSANCRCIGCKNMPPPRGFGPPPPPPVSLQHVYPPPPPPPANRVPAPTVDAAQNLTFLKHASPPSKRRHSVGSVSLPPPPPPSMMIQEAASMPSLASSSDASPGEKTIEDPSEEPPETESKVTKDADEKKTPSKTGFNELLMAAYAMTELQTGPSPQTTPEKTEPSKERKEQTPTRRLVRALPMNSDSRRKKRSRIPNQEVDRSVVPRCVDLLTVGPNGTVPKEPVVNG